MYQLWIIMIHQASIESFEFQAEVVSYFWSELPASWMRFPQGAHVQECVQASKKQGGGLALNEHIDIIDVSLWSHSLQDSPFQRFNTFEPMISIVLQCRLHLIHTQQILEAFAAAFQSPIISWSDVTIETEQKDDAKQMRPASNSSMDQYSTTSFFFKFLQMFVFVCHSERPNE